MKPVDLMGRLVVVTMVYRKHKSLASPADLRKYRTSITYLAVDLPKPRTGWYVGERNLRTGDIEPGSYEDPAVFHGKGNIKAHAVVFWPTMAPVLVPEGGLRLAAIGPNFPDSDPRPYSPSGNPANRKLLADHAREHPNQYPRDGKGRFISG